MTISEQTAPAVMDTQRPPSFVDLRAFVAEVEPRLAALADEGSADAYLVNRVALLSAGTQSPVSALYLPTDSGSVASVPHDEFILVLKGQLHLETERQSHMFGADAAAVIPHGCRFAWRAEADTTAIVLQYPHSKPARGTITPISKNPPLAPSAKPADDVLLGPAPDCRNFNDYRVDNGKFVCGTWDSTPYRRKGFLYAHFEIMLITEGSVTFSDEHGSGTFKTGDIVLAEAGSRCAWDSKEDVTKVFAIYRT